MDQRLSVNAGALLVLEWALKPWRSGWSAREAAVYQMSEPAAVLIERL